MLVATLGPTLVLIFYSDDYFLFWTVPAANVFLLGFHAVLEVGLAIFVFILWVVIQDYLWNGGFCGGYFAAFSGKTRYIEDLYYSMDDGVDSYAVY